MKIFKKLFLLACILVGTQLATQAEEIKQIVVDQKGKGNFTSISDAINSLPEINVVPVKILVKNGVYTEKILLNRDNIYLVGEDKSKTRITFNQPKSDWVKAKDYVGAAVVNITADNITIQNLTLENSITKVGPTAYVIYGTGTKTIINNCNILNNGCNTVSLMDYKTGMYYLKDCHMEGAVDFFKAMGWCYVENCSFYQKEAISSVWHAGITDADQKMVIKNSSFDGVEHFFLGRNHYDAQFFIIGCKFSERLANKDFYRKTYDDPEKARNYPAIYGDRYYFADNSQQKTKYAWLKVNNLKDYNKKLKASKIDAQFTFGNQWNPEETLKALNY